MKKAKLFFSAIAVVVVVSGALAFKAKTFGAANVYTNENGHCDLLTVYQTTDSDPTRFDIIGDYSLTSLSTPCPTNQTYTVIVNE